MGLCLDIRFSTRSLVVVGSARVSHPAGSWCRKEYIDLGGVGRDVGGLGGE